MKDRELNEILRASRVPELTAADCERLSRNVIEEIEKSGQAAQAGVPVTLRTRPAPKWTLPALGFGLAAACILVGVVVGRWGKQEGSKVASQPSEIGVYYREIAALFPRQVRAIVLDDQGLHMELAADPDVPQSEPVFLKICGPHGCRRFVTFSGQQVQVNGEVCEVLLDHTGVIMVVGPHVLWSSRDADAKTGSYRIEARPLEGAS
jgi:hypothetical protein